MQALWLGKGQERIWHSTYYTFLQRWEGPIIMTVADMTFERLPQLYHGAAYDYFREHKRRCIMKADALTCISEATKRDILEFYGIPEAKIHVTPLGYSRSFRILPDAEYSPIFRSGKPFLLYLGNRFPHENFETLLRAYSRWHLSKDIDLLIVGTKLTRNEVRYFVQLGIEGRVHTLQNLNDSDLALLYNRAIALVYPSLHEGFGIPLLEAMACGCPIVASRIPSNIEVGGECPIFFEPMDIENLCSGLDNVVSEGRNSKRARVGFERVKRYSWDETAKQTLQAYRSLL